MMNEAVFKQTFFPFGSPEMNSLKDLCHRKAYNLDEVMSLLCTAFNGRLDWEFVKNKYDRVTDTLKIYDKLGIDYRRMNG